MSERYIARGIAAAEFVNDYPDAVGRSTNAAGHAAFGPDPVRIADKLGRPDFDSTLVYLVLVDDTRLYLAFSEADEGPIDGYPPAHIKLQVIELDDGLDLEAIGRRIRAESSPTGTSFEGVILPGIQL